MARGIIETNLSNKKNFIIECQKCKCQQVELLIDEYFEPWISDELTLRCKHCGHEQIICTIVK